MSNDRRDFLTWAGGAAAVAALPTFPTRLTASVPGSEPRSPDISSADWDMSWVQKLTGKYKMVFDAPEVEHGLPIVRANVVGAQYSEVFGVGMPEVSRVLVLRHHAIDFAMNDSYWKRFNIGAAHGFKQADGSTIDYNPIRVPNAAIPAPFRPMMLVPFQQSGGIVLACSLALAFEAAPHYATAGMSQKEANAAAKADMLPGITLQPSGVFAVGVAQGAGCGLVPVSAGA